MEEVNPPKKKVSPLRILVALVIALALLGLLSNFLLPSHSHCKAKEWAAKDLIGQLSQAIEAYHLDFGVYPPGDGSGTRTVTEALSKRGPKNVKYFDFPADLPTSSGDSLTSSGDVENPIWRGAPAPQGIIHYQCPGTHQPQAFDIWAEDCQGHPTGVNNW